MGLACKNAILIVEFARELELQGKGIVEAALEACRLRLRPIVMTSIAFIAGTVPLVLSHGAGARSALGHRHHRVRRHARRDPVRPVPDAGVLRWPALVDRTQARATRHSSLMLLTSIIKGK